jgi:hypothetical protein
VQDRLSAERLRLADGRGKGLAMVVAVRNDTDFQVAASPVQMGSTAFCSHFAHRSLRRSTLHGFKAVRLEVFFMVV